jgi:hypothetical protein
MDRWELMTRRLPLMPKWKTERALRRLSKKALAERCWAAEANADHSMESQSEAWARAAELVEMLEGKRPVDHDLIQRMNEHRAHVISCRAGSCEHEYAALMRIPTTGDVQ